MFMTDRDIDRLVAHFEQEPVISREALLEGYGLTPERIKSLVYSNVLDEMGKGKETRYRPGKLWYSTGTHYRYGSKTAKNLHFLSWRMQEDWERAYMFHPGDVVGHTWSGDVPGKKGVVVHVMPVVRRVLVRWPYGTELEDASTLQLIIRDNGSRQVDVPTVDKDFLADYPYNNFSFDAEEYRLQRDKYKNWSLQPHVVNDAGLDDKETKAADLDKKASKKASIDVPSIIIPDGLQIEDPIQNFKFTGGLSKTDVTRDQMKRIANVLTQRGALVDDLNSEYLLTQAEIVVSVNTEKNNPMYKDTPWLITAGTEGNINDNGDGWTSPVLRNTYQTFRGAYNFYEHDQRIHKSKGRVIDAVLRKVPVAGSNGEFYYAVEILVATNKKHSKLASRVERGELKTLSMGCSAAYTICSQCGNVSYSPETRCEHLLFRKGGYFLDQYGQKRVIAELCGSEIHPDSVEFEEASFVEVPAWRNAKVHNIIAKSTSLVNVVGYLSTRLYNKHNIEFILSDGKLDEVKFDIKKIRANSETVHEVEDKTVKVKAQEDPFAELAGGGDELGLDEAAGEALMGSEDPQKEPELELAEFYDEPVKYEGLLEENITSD